MLQNSPKMLNFDPEKKISNKLKFMNNIALWALDILP